MIGMSPQVGERPVKNGMTEGGGRSAGIRLLAAAWGVRSSDFPELEFRGMYKCFDCGTFNAALGQFGKQQKCRNAPTRMAQADMWPESIDVMCATETERPQTCSGSRSAGLVDARTEGQSIDWYGVLPLVPFQAGGLDGRDGPK